MMIRNETFRDGAPIAAEVIDLDAGTYSLEEAGVVVETRPLTPDEIANYTPTPAPNAAADALDRAADEMDGSIIASDRAAADELRAAAAALRGST